MEIRMRTALLVSVALLGFGTTAAFAQNDRSGPQNQEWNEPPAQNWNGPQNQGWNGNPGGSAPADGYQGVPPTNAYRGGAGSPFSNQASNINGATVRSDIAPRLPSPDASGNSTGDYLRAALRAIEDNQTGAAQSATERAMTRFLNGAMDSGRGFDALRSYVMHDLVTARQALAAHDLQASHDAIETALNRLHGNQG
jgi:hypothetical protein